MAEDRKVRTDEFFPVVAPFNMNVCYKYFELRNNRLTFNGISCHRSMPVEFNEILIKEIKRVVNRKCKLLEIYRN